MVISVLDSEKESQDEIYIIGTLNLDFPTSRAK